MRRRSDTGSGENTRKPTTTFSDPKSSPDAHLDLAYKLPFLGRIDEAKAHVATILKLDPTMTIRENDAFYRLLCFEPAFREKMAGVLRQAGLPE